MSTYTPNLRLTLPIRGETAWGNKVNNGITALVETAISGMATITMADDDYTLTQANGATDEARAMFLTFEGVLSGQRNVVCPSLSKLYMVRNCTTQPVQLRTEFGSGVVVPVGKATALQCDGVNVVPAIDYLPALSQSHDLSLTHEQSVAADIWVITHGLGKFPSVTITDSAGDSVDGEVHYTDPNTLFVSFSAPFSGKAFLN